MNATAEFQDRLNQVAKDIEALLDRLLGHDPAADELGRPPRLLEAMRYASLGAGKRFRPVPGGRERGAVRRAARSTP